MGKNCLVLSPLRTKKKAISGFSEIVLLIPLARSPSSFFLARPAGSLRSKILILNTVELAHMGKIAVRGAREMAFRLIKQTLRHLSTIASMSSLKGKDTICVGQSKEHSTVAHA